MRIVSKFSDYYDGCTYMCGEDIVYERIMNNRVHIGKEHGYSDYKEDSKLKELEKVYNKYNRGIARRYSIDNSLVIIGEKVIPFLTVEYDEGYKFIYDINDLDSLFDENNVSKHYKSKLREHFKKSNYDLYREVRKISSDVIISFSLYTDAWDVPIVNRMDSYVTINPKLKNLGTSKFLEPHQCIQEIELYLNKLNSQEQDVVFSNDVKIQSAGFDDKSFRHRV